MKLTIVTIVCGVISLAILIATGSEWAAYCGLVFGGILIGIGIGLEVGDSNRNYYTAPFIKS